MRCLAGQDFEQDCPQTVDVGSLVHVLHTASCLLRRHVRWRAKFLSRLRRFRLSVVCHDDRCRVFVLAAHRASKAPVQHESLTVFTQHDILGLQVAMNHTARMCVGDGVADAQKDVEQPPFRERVFGSSLFRRVVLAYGFGERITPHQLHRVERSTLITIHFIDRHNARMLELTGDLSLFDQPPDSLARR